MQMLPCTVARRLGAIASNYRTHPTFTQIHMRAEQHLASARPASRLFYLTGPQPTSSPEVRTPAARAAVRKLRSER